MTLDTSAWKINDPQWVKQREEKWPIFEDWLYRFYSSLDGALVPESMHNAKIFYDTGVLNKDVEGLPGQVGFERALVLAPSLTRNFFKELINFYSLFGNRQDLKGSLRQYYLGNSRYNELIGKVIPSDFMLQLLRSAYGNSLTEAAQILEFEVEKVCYRVVNDMGPIIFNYYFNNLKTLDFQTANHLIPIYIDALKLLNDEDARNCDFVFSQHVKRKRKYYDAGLVSDPDRLAIMNSMLVEIKKVWNELNPIVQEKLSPLVE